MPEPKPEESWLPVFPHLSKTIHNKIDNFFDIEDFLHLISDLPPPLLSQLAVVCPIVGQSSPCAFRAVPPSHQVSQSLFLTIWKIFFNVDMVDSVHLLLLQLQKSIVGPGSGASLVVLAKAPPLSWCWCKPSSGVSVSSPNQPVFPAGWCCGGTLQLLQQPTVSRGLTTASGLVHQHHVSAPGRLAPETQWCTAPLIQIWCTNANQQKWPKW